MATFSRGSYVCRSCARSLGLPIPAASRNQFVQYQPLAQYFRRHASTSGEVRQTSLSSDARPFRLAIIGSGPAGFYSAAKILEKMEDAVVDMYEQLPAPFGLVRYGVAPDHPEVKNCQERFEQVAQSPRFNFIGNVTVGRDVPLRIMKPYYDAILFAYGASEDKTLGVPGEQLDGIYSARAFVGWYNGLPEYADLAPDLDAEKAVVIGNGNVALDVARILLSDLDTLKGTDISEHAIATLSKSKVKRVFLVGRRGPMQASFTMKELRELMTLTGVGFQYLDAALVPDEVWISKLPKLQQRRYRMAKLLREGSRRSWQNAQKQWSLLSLLSPASFNSGTGNDSNHLESITFTRNAYDKPENRFDGNAYVNGAEGSETLSTRLAFRSIGYRSAPLSGLSDDLGIPFDDRYGIIPNDKSGRILTEPKVKSRDENPGFIPGCYCTGWVKKGPTGVIASTMEDAFVTADTILNDWKSDETFLNGSSRAQRQGPGSGWRGVVEDSGLKGQGTLRRVAWDDWLKIDKAEQQRGKPNGKPREKFRSPAEMLRVLD